LIVAPDALMPAVAPLVAHKNATGMRANAVSIESLKGYFSGKDDPEVIKRAVCYAYENLSTKYLMLAGDAHMFPARYRYTRGLSVPYARNPPNDPDAVVPMLGDYLADDHYYVDLYHHGGKYPSLAKGSFDDWDASQHGLYNEFTHGDTHALTTGNPDHVDGYPDLAVGRVPAHTAADMTAYVNKVISYEKSTRQVALTFVADQAYPGADKLLEGMLSKSRLLKGIAANRVKYLQIEATKPVSAPWVSATAADVAAAAATSTFVQYVGHGDTHEWGHSDHFFVEANVLRTNKSTTLPVVCASGCETGEFISGHPWHQEYVDTSNVRHDFVVVPNSTPNAPGPVIEDKVSHKYWGVGPQYQPLPLIAPTPNAYDYDIADRCFSYTWLIKAAPGGAIAYFGDMGVSPLAAPNEFYTYLQAAYVDNEHPILGDLYLTAQRKYWGNHETDEGGRGWWGVARLYFGYTNMAGDPSLRLPVLT
jgi:hypothetical protein